MSSTIEAAWIASIPGIGPKRYAELVSRFGELSFFLQSSENELLAKGLPEKIVRIIEKHRKLHPPEEIAQYCARHAITILTQKSSAYPALLHEIADPPIVLYMKGKLPVNSHLAIAVVGTRHITEYGVAVTRELTRQLCEAGCVIVSGFMYGVDAVAHRTALENRGTTIGVLGFGFDFMYPAEHWSLAHDMITSGNCLLTEYPYWQAPSPSTFPRRNRIVSGMSHGVLVTEAASKSGTKITANLAVEQGREVYAVPGPISSPYSEGTKDLINMGATLVSSAQDVLEELHLQT